MKDFNPGMRPLEYKVIVHPDPIEETMGNEVKFVKVDQTKSKDRFEQTRATLIDFTDMAFEGWKCELPKRGQKVEICRAVGQFFIGTDGKEYKLINDQDIAGVVTAE